MWRQYCLSQVVCLVRDIAHRMRCNAQDRPPPKEELSASDAMVEEPYHAQMVASSGWRPWFLYS